MAPGGDDYIKPTLCSSEICENSEIITAADDNPEPPKQDDVKTKKRSRLSPKKLDIDFTRTNFDENDKMEPQVKYQKKLSVSPDQESSKVKQVLSVEKSSVEVSSQNAGSSSSKSFPENIASDGKTDPELLKDTLKNSTNLKGLQQVLQKVHPQKKKQKKKERRRKENDKAPETAVAKKREKFAYEMLDSLAQEIPKGLALPQKYKLLQEFFRCTDVIVSMLFNRQQVASWPVFQKAVQEIVRKNFELKHLRQIKFAFPQAYMYRQEKGVANSSTNKISTSDYQLTVEPNLGDSKDHSSSDQQRKFTSGMLIKRRHHFHVQLLNIVKEHHEKFLSSLNPPVVVPELQKILRWHTKFALDSVPDVGVADLPKPPETGKGRCHSAKDVLRKARSKLPKKITNALKNVAEKLSSTPEKAQTPTDKQRNNQVAQSTTASRTQAKTVHGISQSLLDKVRAKEATKKLKTMIRSEEATQNLQRLTRLPNLARVLRTLFTVEKKSSLPLEYICKKLVTTCSGISTPYTVRDHVLLLIKLEPTWLRKVKVKNCSYVKMTQGKEVAAILQNLEQKIKEAEKV